MDAAASGAVAASAVDGDRWQPIADVAKPLRMSARTLREFCRQYGVKISGTRKHQLVRPDDVQAALTRQAMPQAANDAMDDDIRTAPAPRRAAAR